MVLIHGGGGTAFAEWVRMWNREGFAAIAIDTAGTVPEKAAAGPSNPKRNRHEFSGPTGWGDFENVDAPVTDQWSYHAVAVSILAHSFLRSQPGVDPKRIGVAGEEAWAVYHLRAAPQKAEICYTTDTGKWQDRNWQTLPASINPHTRRVSVNISGGARVHYLNLNDARGLIVSTEHRER